MTPPCVIFRVQSVSASFYDNDKIGSLELELVCTHGINVVYSYRPVYVFEGGVDTCLLIAGPFLCLVSDGCKFATI